MSPSQNSKMNQVSINTMADKIEDSGSISFQDMLDAIREIFNRPGNLVDVDEVQRVLMSYRSHGSDILGQKNEWSKYAYYEPYKYKRNLVEEHEKYNVMILTWGLGTKSCIHDHSGAHCFMKVLDGELLERRFAWPRKSSLNETGAMRTISETKMLLNDLVYINDQVGLHSVENPNRNQTAVSLHIYIPPYSSCRAFDQFTGQAIECRLSFHSERGKLIHRSN